MSGQTNQQNNRDTDDWCRACVPLDSIRQQADWTSVPAMIICFIVGLVAISIPFHFPGGARLINVICLTGGAVSLWLGVMTFRAAFLGTTYFGFYAIDDRRRRLPALHIHREQPVQGNALLNPAERRFLALREPTHTDALGAAKLGHSHPTVLEVDGPWFELNTGLIARSTVHNCPAFGWEMIGFRVVEGTGLEIDVRWAGDHWTRLRLPITHVVMLFGGRSSFVGSSICDTSSTELIELARSTRAANDRAHLADVRATIAEAGLAEIGALVISRVERSSVAQAVRENVIGILEQLGQCVGPDLNKIIEQLTALRAAADSWKQQYGSDPKPPRSARKGRAAATPAEAT